MSGTYCLLTIRVLVAFKLAAMNVGTGDAGFRNVIPDLGYNGAGARKVMGNVRNDIVCVWDIVMNTRNDDVPIYSILMSVRDCLSGNGQLATTTQKCRNPR
jgi:hypothetical protein